MRLRPGMRILSFVTGALLAGGALAQTPDSPSSGEVIGGPVGGPDTEPFVSPGLDAHPYTPPPFSHGSGYVGRGLDAKGSFDFDSLLTPGARGSKRSMSRPNRMDFRIDR